MTLKLQVICVHERFSRTFLRDVREIKLQKLLGRMNQEKSSLLGRITSQKLNCKAHLAVQMLYMQWREAYLTCLFRVSFPETSLQFFVPSGGDLV